MPTMESIDYERFSYGEAAPSLTLDEAVKKARELRRQDSGNFYRIEAVDESANAFRIEKVSSASLYTEFIARLAKALTRYARVSAKR
jgi:hypothetical protein